MDWRVRLPGALYRRAVQQAEAAHTDLQTVVRRLLDLYVAGTIDPMVEDPIASAIGRRGGQASAQHLSEDERKARAQRAAQARWQPPHG